MGTDDLIQRADAAPETWGGDEPTSMVVLKLAEETLSADEAVVEDSRRGAQELRDQRVAQESTRADP